MKYWKEDKREHSHGNYKKTDRILHQTFLATQPNKELGQIYGGTQKKTLKKDIFMMILVFTPRLDKYFCKLKYLNCLDLPAENLGPANPLRSSRRSPALVSSFICALPTEPVLVPQVLCLGPADRPCLSGVDPEFYMSDLHKLN